MEVSLFLEGFASKGKETKGEEDYDRGIRINMDILLIQEDKIDEGN